MKKIKPYFWLTLPILFSQIILFPSQGKAGGAFGAEIYCSMRDGGNEHENSWEAAYAYIKRQKGGFFKISPKQAAGQIVETVVRERDKFEYCIPYLSELYPEQIFEKKNNKDSVSEEDLEAFEANEPFDRYSY